MTEPLHPGLKVPLSERLAAAREALDRGEEQNEPEVVEDVDEPEVVDPPDPEVTIDHFDTAAHAARAWDRAGRIVRPEDRPGDRMVRLLAGDDSALDDMALAWRRGGGRWSINGASGEWTPTR